MDSLFKFKLTENEPFSKQCIHLGIHTFSELIRYVQLLQYGRNSESGNYHLILTEQKGTCSTKHAFLAKIAEENNKQDIVLCIGMYKMNSANTPGIGNTLEKNKLEYIPEAHTYLKCNGVRSDFTRKGSDSSAFEADLIFEEEIGPNQIGQYKTSLHKAYLKKWIKEESLQISFEDLWQIRETCIKNLSIS